MSETDSDIEGKTISTWNIKKRPKKTYLSANEKMIALNVFQRQFEKNAERTVDEIVTATANITGVSKCTIYRIRKENKEGEISSPKRKKPRPKISQKVDDFEKNAIRRIVHQFFFRGELPTLGKVLEEVNGDNTLGNFKKSSFHKLLRDMNFKFTKQGRTSFLNDNDDIVVWRRNYLRKLRQFREENRPIYYLGETWINVDDIKNKVWQDLDITSARAAFLSDQSTGLKNPSCKGKRLILAHIGSDKGFVQDVLWVFDSKKTVNYPEEMNSASFETWFSKVLDKLERNAVVVMDNTPYHTRKIEKIPNAIWEKEDIKNWLRSKGVTVPEDMVKTELLHLIKQQSTQSTYAVDEMAAVKNMTVLRLPPYHCELNPIELIWGQVKNYVTTKNVILQVQDMKSLFRESTNKITPQDWKKCVDHVVTKVENEFWELDQIIENTMESFVINLNESNSSESNTDTDFE